MQTATVSELKRELHQRSPKELIELCLTLAKFKKENKELLTYLLYEKSNEEGYIRGVKRIMDEMFDDINTHSYFYIKKAVRKILRATKRYIRYSKRKDTEVELLLYFCEKMKAFSPSYRRNRVLTNLYDRQIEAIRKKLPKLEEDLQYDYGEALKELE
ncbi:MAG: hypothetical protein AAF573_04930 [Bacteroidota bacterium]